MGWLFTRGQTLKELIVRQTRGWENTLDDGTPVRNACLRHCYRGGRFSGVFWTVWERTFCRKEDGRQVRPAERWIGCDLLRFQNGYGWGYKDMTESMGPYCYSCPLGYLELVSPANEQWRAGVREYHARLAQRRRARRSA